MDKPAAELSRAWLLKAHSDLDTARQIGSLPDWACLEKTGHIISVWQGTSFGGTFTRKL